MATLQDKQVRVSGGTPDYTSVQAYWDATPSSLVTADEQWDGRLYDEDESTTFNTPVLNMASRTTDATRYIRIIADAGQGLYRSSSNALRYDGTKGAAMKCSGGGGSSLTITGGCPNYTQLIGIQVLSTSSRPMQWDNPSAQTTIDRCLFEAQATSPCIINGVDNIVRRSVFIQDTDTTDIVQMTRSGNQGHVYYFCHFVRPSNRTQGGDGIQVKGGYTTAHIVKNCFFGNCASGQACDDFTNVTASYNAAAPGTVGGGTNNQDSLTYANQVIQPSSASSVHDFRIKSGANLDAAGNSVSGITTDFFEDTYDDPPAIGPDEDVAAPGANDGAAVYHYFQQQGVYG